MELGIALIIGIVSWALFKGSGRQKGNGPMRPYLRIDGRLREIVHRKRFGDSVVCTIKPLTKGSARSRVIVPAKGDNIEWLPKR